MPADNSIYQTNGLSWWDQNNFLYTLKTGLNSARFEYFCSLLSQQKLNASSLNVLDIGCGGGFLSEEFARLGCSVSGIDLSTASIATAVKHARDSGLCINYLSGSVYDIPYPAASFDLVICCDVLEHLSNINAALSEAARMLKPAGLFLFDTINRTTQSYIETILVAQELPITRFFAPGTHDWHQFIQPDELKSSMKKFHLSLIETRGLKPGISAFQTTLEMLRLKLGQINFAEFGRRLNFHVNDNLSGSYIGYAAKTR